ncbi:MAG: DsrE/DsrF/DrsH-like family protein [Rhodospirillales bacterium]|nr:DsrE/DsrF/DrsH-like family protein [Rhodospirillales bacterium]
MPADSPARTGPEKLSLIVQSDAFERVHYALVMASAAAAIGTPATLFFTNHALTALRAADATGELGWRTMSGVDGRPGGMLDDARRARGVAGFEELLEACVAFGVRFIACEMGLRVMGLEATLLRSDVPIETAGVVTFLADASTGGALLAL